MPVYRLPKDNIFPNPLLAEPDGLLAVGGDLSIERLLLAYSNAIFPWYNKGEEILWWAPNPRPVLFLDDFKPSKSLLQTIRNKNFEVKFNSDFKSVIENCAKVKRKGQYDTWITAEMKQAYIKLHKLGYAYSVETYLNNKLVGGLYGVAIGKVFFGESMFHLVSDASKIALVYLVDMLKQNNYKLIDVQQKTQLLESFGAKEIDLQILLDLLKL